MPLRTAGLEVNLVSTPWSTKTGPDAVSATSRKSQNKEAGSGRCDGRDLKYHANNRTRASRVSPEHTTPPPVQRPNGWRARVITVAYTNASSLGNKRSEL